jgi:hypothetical protein
LTELLMLLPGVVLFKSMLPFSLSRPPPRACADKFAPGPSRVEPGAPEPDLFFLPKKNDMAKGPTVGMGYFQPSVTIPSTALHSQIS